VISEAVQTATGRWIRGLNFGASLLVIGAAIGAFALVPQNRKTLGRLYGPPEWAFTGFEFLWLAAALYATCLLLFFLLEPQPSTSKSLRFLQISVGFARSPVETWRKGLLGTDRVAVLTTLLKAFFAPLMVHSLMIFCVGVWVNGAQIISSDIAQLGWLALFDQAGFWFFMQAILFVDVGIFTFGYLVELPSLKNQIRSVDPTLIGWLAALMCYPPFNSVTGKLLGTPVSDFPQFSDPTVHLSLNLGLLLLMAIYASASVALGWKASNLTHRGIIARGPYAVVRHPAYVCKNLAWWIGASPFVIAQFGASTLAGLTAAGSMLAWSSIYVLRALTEEDHLRGVDNEYAAYASRVRYRFIPGVV
jgi:protein-S-isoprenylcysteine O-methyltransferase Ste14